MNIFVAFVTNMRYAHDGDDDEENEFISCRKDLDEEGTAGWDCEWINRQFHGFPSPRKSSLMYFSNFSVFDNPWQRKMQRGFPHKAAPKHLTYFLSY